MFRKSSRTDGTFLKKVLFFLVSFGIFNEIAVYSCYAPLYLKTYTTKGEVTMVTSIILMNVERPKINEVAAALADMSGISEVYSVSGNYDLVAIARVENNEKLSDLVTKQMLKLEGIRKTETMLAFQSYSRHDLDAMFSIGLDGI
jgi:DNA-binding Lrp family transcriptional regulator